MAVGLLTRRQNQVVLYQEEAQRQVRELLREILRSCDARFPDPELIRAVRHAHGYRHELVRLIERSANRHKTFATTVRRLELAELHMGNLHEAPPVASLCPPTGDLTHELGSINFNYES